ncbi:twitching motility protein PilT [Bacteroidia bacterium]|nr:twitching motility protein PilT [Bacteroidia bacterium]GHT05140.1 twitching motility protein PilT [Bacteroidia bacterium]
MKRYLLDTNIVLFSLFNQDELDRGVDDLLSDYNNLFYISSVSLQEIIHLYKRHKINTAWKSAEDILPSILGGNLEMLPVKREHLATYAKLITAEFHNDPCDHIIISQAITENITLISSDRKFEVYTKQKLELSSLFSLSLRA